MTADLPRPTSSADPASSPEAEADERCDLTDEDSHSDVLESLIQTFVDAYRADHSLTIQDFAAQYPDEAERIRGLLPYVLMMEELRSETLTRVDSETTIAGVAETPPEVFSPELHPKPPELGDYILLSKLGSGGMGRVFKARHRRMDRVVALKVLPRSATAEPKAVKRFHREMKMAARLFHPNIVTAFDAGEADGVLYLAMEFVNGPVLSKLVQAHGPLTVAKAAAYVRQAAQGLGYAHEHGVIHRDVKPSNLVSADDGSIKVFDFGLARVSAAASLTRAGAILGTVSYMSPEQILHPSEVDARSDIYSLGCTLFYLLFGQPPFTGSPVETIRAHKEQPPPQLRQVRDDVPPELDRVFSRMIAKDVAHRYQDMREVISALRQVEELCLATERRERSPAAAVRPTAFGIDLGDTYSQLACMSQSEKPILLSLRDNGNRLRSRLSIDGMNVRVGAQAAGGKGSANDLRQVLMGSSTRACPTGSHPPAVLLALFLCKLFDLSGRDIADCREAVIAVPNCLDEPARQAFYDAAQIAGINRLRLAMDTSVAALTLFTEPTLPSPRDGESILAIAVGASRLSVALLRREGDTLNTLASDGLLETESRPLRTALQRVITRAGIDWDAVVFALLAGGPDRLPGVSQLLAKLAHRELTVVAAPDAWSAIGAASLAASGSRPYGKTSEPPTVTEITTCDLAVARTERATGRKRYSLLIPAGTPLPATMKASFTTVRDGQESASIELAQRPPLQPDAWRLVGSCVIGNLPPDRPSGERIPVEFRCGSAAPLSMHLGDELVRRGATQEVNWQGSLSNAELSQWREWTETMMLCSGLLDDG